MTRWFRNNWFNILAVVLLLGALAKWPYGYYQSLRWVISVVGAYGVYLAHNNKQNVWMWILGIIAVLFNPFVPFYLQRDTWQLIDLITAAIFFVRLFMSKYNRVSNE